MVTPETLAKMRFLDAAGVWLDTRRPQLRPVGFRDYKQCITALSFFFSEMQLDRIHIGHFEQYQKMRSEGTGGLRRAGPSRINHELNTLSQMLARAGLSAAIADFYKPLRIPKSKRAIALSDEERVHLFDVSKQNPKWRVAYLASLVSENTAAGPGELLGLTLQDVVLDGCDPQIHICEHIKNRHRDRWLPLNSIAAEAIAELLEIARKKGACSPEHFLFPHRAARAGEGWDLTRPMYGYRKAWLRIRAEAAKKFPRLGMVGPYVLRHTTMTRLLEDPGNTEAAVEEIAGWTSMAMKKVYSHIRTKAKREALDRLAGTSSALENSSTSPAPALSPPSFSTFQLNSSTLTGERISTRESPIDTDAVLSARRPAGSAGPGGPGSALHGVSEELLQQLRRVGLLPDDSADLEKVVPIRRTKACAK